MNENELERLVKRVAADFSATNKITVTDRAINELVKPALPNLGDLTKDLKEQKVSVQLLERSLAIVLRNALNIARESRENYIGFAAIQKSIAKECPYVFWC